MHAGMRMRQGGSSDGTLSRKRKRNTTSDLQENDTWKLRGPDTIKGAASAWRCLLSLTYGDMVIPRTVQNLLTVQTTGAKKVHAASTAATATPGLSTTGSAPMPFSSYEACIKYLLLEYEGGMHEKGIEAAAYLAITWHLCARQSNTDIINLDDLEVSFFESHVSVHLTSTPIVLGK